MMRRYSRDERDAEQSAIAHDLQLKLLICIRDSISPINIFNFMVHQMLTCN